MKKFKEYIDSRLTGRLKKCYQFSGNLKDKIILDIGCGIGWFEKMAIETSCKRIIGIEPAGERIKQTKKEVPQAIFKTGIALKLPFEENYFDLITMFDVLEHLPENSESRALKEIKRVLKKKASLIISTPSSSFLSKILDPAWYFGHRHYSANQLKRLLENEGFSVEEIDCGGGIWELLAMIFFYSFKPLGFEIPFKDWFEKKREEEYLKEGGFVTLFIKVCSKDR